MSHRKRIVDTLRGQRTDRAPWGVGLGFRTWGPTMERWREESGISDLNLDAYFGFDPDFAVLPLAYGVHPHFEHEIVREDEAFIVARDWRGILRRDRRDGASMPEFIEHPIKTADDWRRYKAERLQPCLDERVPLLEGWRRDIESRDAPVQFGVFPWGPFGTARDLLGAEGLLYAFYDEPEMVRDIMQTHTQLWVTLLRRAVLWGPIDRVHLWEDMAGRQGSLISMAMVEAFMMPCYDLIADACADCGVPVFSVDSDGRVDALVDVMVSHGVNAFEPFEVQAGCDIERTRASHPDLAIIGGLDKTALTRGADAIHAELDRAERMLAAGRYIPGLDHLIPPDVPWAAWLTFATELRKLCGA